MLFRSLQSASSVSPDSENGRERGRDSWAAEGRANEAEPPVAWDGSLRYRAGECWLSVEGLLQFSMVGRRAEQARWHRRFEFLDSVLVDEHTGTGPFLFYPFRRWSGFYFWAARSGKGATAMKTMNMISRRSFLKATAAAAVVSALGLTGCGSSGSSAAASSTASSAAGSAAAASEEGVS